MNSLTKLITFFLFTAATVWADSAIHIFDTPTALNPDRGTYAVSLGVYDQGGVLLKVGIGIAPVISLGMIEFADGLIGSGSNEFSIPGVYCKLSFFEQPPEGLNLAFGYDSFYYGSFREYDFTKVYGIYTVITKGYRNILGEPNLFSSGIRYPLLKDAPRRPELFASHLLRLGRYFSYGLEITDITFSPTADYLFINNHTLSFRINHFISAAFILQLAPSWIPDAETVSGQRAEMNFSRNLFLSYINFF